MIMYAKIQVLAIAMHLQHFCLDIEMVLMVVELLGGFVHLRII